MIPNTRHGRHANGSGPPSRLSSFDLRKNKFCAMLKPCHDSPERKSSPRTSAILKKRSNSSAFGKSLSRRNENAIHLSLSIHGESVKMLQVGRKVFCFMSIKKANRLFKSLEGARPPLGVDTVTLICPARSIKLLGLNGKPNGISKRMARVFRFRAEHPSGCLLLEEFFNEPWDGILENLERAI